MKVCEFCDRCFEPSLCMCNIYDTNKADVVFKGTMEEVMESQYADYDVDSFDVPCKADEMTLNITVE